MKNVQTSLLLLLLGLTLFLAKSPSALAQVALTVNPSTTSNTYTGVITVKITGLGTGEKVNFQRWLDLNGNGSIDGNDMLIDAFKLTDNNISNALIGGATNVNVPFDLNPTNGSITAKLNFAIATVLDTMVGHYIFKVVSPSNNFTPVTATFTVTDSGLSQSVSGTVLSNGLTPFPNAVVVAQDIQANNPLGATVADAAGHYFLTLPPGTYGLLAGFPNFFTDTHAGPLVVLTNGMASTNNISLSNGTAAISGTIFDNNSNVIPGLLLQLKSGNLFAVAFTDTNGNFSNLVSPSFWTIQPVKQRMARRALVLPGTDVQVNASSGSASTNIVLPHGNAMYYGRIADASNNPYANVEADGSAGGNFDTKGYSDANGNYAVAIIGDNSNFWSCGLDSGKNTSIANFIANQANSQTFSPNEAVLQNFILLPATAQISGRLTDNSGNPITGVGLNANATVNSLNYSSLDATTDNSGNYSLLVANGQWSVQCFTGNFNDSLENKGFVDPSAPHFVPIPPTNQVLNITAFPIGTPFIGSPARAQSTNFNLLVFGASNVNYTVQVLTNLNASNWSTLTSFKLTTNPFPVTDLHATNGQRFYRVQKN